jgi:hypothetical protein
MLKTHPQLVGWDRLHPLLRQQFGMFKGIVVSCQPMLKGEVQIT